MLSYVPWDCRVEKQEHKPFTQTALSYGRVIGATTVSCFGHVGVGNRGRGLEYILSALKDSRMSRS